MKLAQTREARALALAAVKHGFVAPEALWDMACRWTLGGAESPKELLSGVLSPDQIEAIAAEPVGSKPPPDALTSAAQTVADRNSFETLMFGVSHSDRPPLDAEVDEPRYDLG